MSRPEHETEAAPERNAAKEQLVGSVAAAWGAGAAEGKIAAIKDARGDKQVRALLEELAGSILAEAHKRFGHDPAFSEVWREAANEAACSRLSAVASQQGRQ